MVQTTLSMMKNKTKQKNLNYVCKYTYVHYFFEGIRVFKAVKTKAPKSQTEGKLRGSAPTFGIAFPLKPFWGSHGC